MTRPLPHDVLEDVFEFVRSPVGLLGTWRKDCLACTYVCKEWKYAAQAALYHNIGIPVKKRLSRFLTFLKRHPNIAAHIRTVSIWRYEDNRDKLGFPIRPVLLLKVLAALPKLQTLELFRVVLSGWPQSSPLPTTPTHLSTLKLIDLIVNFKGETDRCLSFDFLRLFSADTLEVQGYDDEHLPCTPRRVAPEEVLSSPAPVPIVRNLRLIGKSSFMMMNAELGGLDPTHLSALMLKPTQPGRAWFTGKLVRSYGPSITRLEFQATYLLRWPSEQLTTEMWAEFCLSSFRQLESLRLHWGDLYECPANGALSEAYRTFLSFIPTPTQLRELCIVVWNQDKEGKTLPWTAPHLSSVITCAVDKFQDLQEITIEVSIRRFNVGLEKIVKPVHDALPERIVKSGLLRFRLGSQ